VDKTLRELTASELHDSRHPLLQLVQRDCFPAEYDAFRHDIPLPTSSKTVGFQPFYKNNLIRLGGRLHFADLLHTETHLILLDASHHVTHLLIRHTHVQLHHLGDRVVLSHLRHEFWILRARQNIKKVLRTCLPCKIASNARGQVVEAPLPAERVQTSTLFAVTGLDFAGPLYTKKDQPAKTYILLLTCATTTVLHLELSTDISVDKFLMALDRFVSRRGLPHILYSDNATTFQAARRELAEICTIFHDQRTFHYFAHRDITWKFIAPRAAWWGGWWKRMVGTTKRCIRKVLGKRQVDDKKMNTILPSIEAAINSRPLTQDDGPECARICLKRGRVQSKMHIGNTFENDIKELDPRKAYNYLGIEENFDIQHKNEKEKLKNEYLRRLRSVLGTELSAKNKIQSIGSLAVPVLTVLELLTGTKKNYKN